MRQLSFYIGGIQKMFEYISNKRITGEKISAKEPTIDSTKAAASIEDSLWRTIGEENITDIRMKMVKEIEKIESNITKHCYEESHMVSTLYKSINHLENLCK